jgi:hypothetical protein
MNLALSRPHNVADPWVTPQSVAPLLLLGLY